MSLYIRALVASRQGRTSLATLAALVLWGVLRALGFDAWWVEAPLALMSLIVAVPLAIAVVRGIATRTVGADLLGLMAMVTAALLGEWLERRANVKFTEVRYKSTPQATQDVLGGVVPIYNLNPAKRGQVLVQDTTSLNFYRACRAAIAARPGRRTIVSDTANFPTDRYILEGIADELGLNLVLIDDEITRTNLGREHEVLTPERIEARKMVDLIDQNK